MRIGVVKEIKDRENRVALTPEGARLLIEARHTVFLEADAGEGSGFSDRQYRDAGARIVSAANAWNSELVLKVKEPLESEYAFLRDQILFTYLHLAAAPKTLAEALLQKGTTAVAYETVEDESGKLPLLAPMSAVAGVMAITIGSYYLARFNQGKGMLLGSVLGRRFGKVTVIGDGVVGTHAARTADGMGTETVLFGKRRERIAALKGELPRSVSVKLSEPDGVSRHVADADLVVGAVLVQGARAPIVVTEEMVKSMEPGSIVVDVSIDQGGCVETSRPTSHSDPVYEKHGVIHYGVTNMPGAYPKTSTIALTAATLPYALKLANRGLAALREDRDFGKGVNIHRGFVTYAPVAESLGLTSKFLPFSDVR